MLTRPLHYCRLVCLHKKKRHWPSAVLENKKCDCVFRRERTEVNLANKVVSAIANMTKNPCCAVAFSIMAPLSFKRPRFSHGAAKREKRERVSSPTLPKPELEQKKSDTLEVRRVADGADNQHLLQPQTQNTAQFYVVRLNFKGKTIGPVLMSFSPGCICSSTRGGPVRITGGSAQSGIHQLS